MIRLNTLNVVVIIDYKYSEAGCLITLGYFKNTSPGRILILVCYWDGNNILDG